MRRRMVEIVLHTERGRHRDAGRPAPLAFVLVDDELKTLAEALDWRSLLNEVEQRVVEGAIRGEAVDFIRDGDRKGVARQLPLIRARVIEVLALGLRSDWPVHRDGIRVAGARVDGRLALDHGEIATPLALTSCEFQGPVSLLTSRLVQLDMRGSRLPSLNADHITVAGSVFLSDGFTATGTVRLLAAKIGDQFHCTGGQFHNSHADGWALLADRIDVAAEVLLDDGFSASGEVRFAAARIGRTLRLSGGSFDNPSGTAFHGNGMTVGGQWILRDARFQGTVSVQGAAVGVLNDDIEGWPQGWRGEGFTFRDFVSDAEVGARERIRWLEGRGGGFWRPHYTSLAEVYRRRGDPTAARAVLIARERTRTAQLTWRRGLIRRLWGVVSAYGYRPQRSIWALGVLILMASVTFAFTDQRPAKEIVPPFSSVMYAVDLALPLVDLQQADSYQPLGVPAQWLAWVTIMTGWFLSLAFVAAVTGIFTPDE